MSMGDSLSTRTLRRSVVAGLILVGCGILGTTVAVAGPKNEPISPVGTYRATEHLPVAIPLTQTLVLTAKGHFSFAPKGPKGTWLDSHGHITMNGTFGTTVYLITIRQSGGNLGSKSRPGEIVTGGQPFATWYAVRK